MRQVKIGINYDEPDVNTYSGFYLIIDVMENGPEQDYQTIYEICQILEEEGFTFRKGFSLINFLEDRGINQLFSGA